MKRTREPIDIRILQGLSFLYTVPVICRIEFQFNDEIDRSLMQKALTDVIEKSNWFNKTVCCRDNKFYICDNDKPVVLYDGDILRAIPDETNGYFFCFTTSYDRLILMWDHFITDGRGGRRLLNTVAALYCNYKYNTDCKIHDLTLKIPQECYVEQSDNNESANIFSAPKSGYEPRGFLSVDKGEWISRAIEHSIKPFSFLTAYIADAIASVNNKDKIKLNYAVDYRDVPNRRFIHFNKSDCFPIHFDFNTDRDNILNNTNDIVLEQMKKQKSLDNIWKEHRKSIEYIYRHNFSYDSKRAFMSMIMADKFNCDVILSYVGNAFDEDYQFLNGYIKDCLDNIYIHQGQGANSVWSDVIFVSAISINNKLKLNINALEKTRELTEKLKEILEKENIPCTAEICEK